MVHRLRASLGAVALASAALAMPAPIGAQEVVQRLPGDAERALTEALQTLARNPRSERALLTAGRSSLELGDVDAALGFFSRARDTNPGSGDALAGLAAVQVRKNAPLTALPLFSAAGREALQPPSIAAEHGLAYDLVGDQAMAQAVYRAALAGKASDEISRRLSLSLAISGDREASEAALLHLLQRQDKAAWRTRAFALAILGATEEAMAVTEAVMPAGLARDMAPFIRIMPRLTGAQQAAAVNLGKFPSRSAIGQDTPEIAAYVPGQVPPVAAAPSTRKPGDALVPQGEPLGRERPTRAVTLAEREAQRRQRREARRAQPPTVSQPVVQAPVEPVVAQDAPVQGPIAENPVGDAFAAAGGERESGAAPGFDLSQVPSEPREAAEPAQEDFASAFGEFSRPDTQVDAASGAVDVTEITPAAPEPEEPLPPAHPARIWVQLGIGRDVDALAFDWRRLRRSYEVLDGRDAYRAPLGQTNRMVTGPFASRSEALDMVNALKDAGHESLIWRSAEGEELVLLPTR